VLSLQKNKVKYHFIKSKKSSPTNYYCKSMNFLSMWDSKSDAVR